MKFYISKRPVFAPPIILSSSDCFNENASGLIFSRLSQKKSSRACWWSIEYEYSTCFDFASFIVYINILTTCSNLWHLAYRFATCMSWNHLILCRFIPEKPSLFSPQGKPFHLERSFRHRPRKLTKKANENVGFLGVLWRVRFGGSDP